MTVKELIDFLSKIEDKNIKVFYIDYQTGYEEIEDPKIEVCSVTGSFGPYGIKNGEKFLIL